MSKHIVERAIVLTFRRMLETVYAIDDEMKEAFGIPETFDIRNVTDDTIMGLMKQVKTAPGEDPGPVEILQEMGLMGGPAGPVIGGENAQG